MRAAAGPYFVSRSRARSRFFGLFSLLAAMVSWELSAHLAERGSPCRVSALEMTGRLSSDLVHHRKPPNLIVFAEGAAAGNDIPPTVPSGCTSAAPGRFRSFCATD